MNPKRLRLTVIYKRYNPSMKLHSVELHSGVHTKLTKASILPSRSKKMAATSLLQISILIYIPTSYEDYLRYRCSGVGKFVQLLFWSLLHIAHPCGHPRKVGLHAITVRSIWVNADILS